MSVGERVGAVNNSRSARGRAFYSTRKKLQVGLIQVNDDEERKGRESLWLPAIGAWGYPIRAYK